MKTLGCFLILAALAAPACLSAAAPKEESLIVYVGTYTGPKSKGIYAWRLETATGAMKPLGLAGEALNPSFLAVHPNQKVLYAVSEIGGGKVIAFSIEPATGKLTELNSVASHGNGPCFVSIDKTGRDALAANYGSGTVAVFPIGSDGRLGEATASIQHAGSSVNKQRQSGPHAHSINVSPDNRFAVASDLGLDQLLVYRFDPAKGTLAPNDPPFFKDAPGAGPRHFTFHPNGKFAYVINELASSVTALTWDARRGVLGEIGTVSALPPDFKGDNSGAEVQVHPGGKFLYASNRGHNSIAVFSIDTGDGRLSLVTNTPTEGRTPRNFGIDPSGTWLIAANQDSDSLVMFHIDPATGKLSRSGEPIQVGRPVCVRFARTGK